MKKIGIFLMAIVLILSGCSSNKPIKVAYVAGITGDLSELGIYGRNAFLMRVDEINAQGGIDGRLIEPLVYDDLNDPEKIKAIYKEIEEEEIDFVVGHILSSLAESVLKEASSEDVLILTATMSTRIIDNVDDYLIRTCISNSQQGKKMGQLIKDDGHRAAILVTDQRNKTYSDEFGVTFESFYDGQVMTIPYLPDDESMEKILQAVESGEYGALIMVTPALDTALISQRIRLINNSLDFYGVSWSMSPDLIANGGKHVEGLKIVYQEADDQFKEARDKFYADYLETYKEESNFVGQITYEISDILFKAMKASKKIEPDQVKKELINHSFHGLSGLITINEYGDRPGVYTTYIVEEGQFIQID